MYYLKKEISSNEEITTHTWHTWLAQPFHFILHGAGSWGTFPWRSKFSGENTGSVALKKRWVDLRGMKKVSASLLNLGCFSPVNIHRLCL